MESVFMSVLFQALNRAARDYRDQQSPLVVPFLPLAPKPSRARFVLVTFAVGLVLTAAAAHTLNRPSPIGGYVVSLKEAAEFVPVPAAPVEPVVPVVADAQPAAVQNVAFPPVAMVAEAPPPVPQPAAAPVAASEPPSLHGNMVSAEPQGIALPVDSLAVPTMEDTALAETVHQLEKEPAATEAKKTKPPAPQVVVKTENAPPLAALLREAHADMTAKRFRKAVILYDKALAQDGNNQDAWSGKVYALQESGTAAARKDLQKMIGARPLSAPAHAALAQVFLRQGDLKAAQASLQRAAELTPGDKTYLLSLAVLHDHMGHDAEALALYRQLPPLLSPEVQERLEYLAAQADVKGSP
jgi:Flp pilus assembly protein TadD